MKTDIKISVIIVNYNVEYFLAQCLTSVLKANEALSKIYPKAATEIFVVDNNSVDGSIRMLKKEFPSVKLIQNKENVGFAKANNQAYKFASGKYILALNPDTLIEENTFIRALNFMEENTGIGAMGPKLINGKGIFLKESKRALPTPWVAFYKIFGLSNLFPKSKKAGKYHLSFLPDNQTNDVDVLAGAFMFLRKSVIDKTGFFDERFFMYGEDIDLSYRILLAGYRVVYFPEITVIHYKGESTKKASFNYVYVFYKAMKIFAEKHFSKKNAFLYTSLINLAIYFRAFLSFIYRVIKSVLLPFYDFIIIYSSFFLSMQFWAWYKWNTSAYYPLDFTIYFLSFYSLIILVTLGFKNNYRMIFHLKNMLSGIFTGGIMLLSLYALFSESLRYSRAILLLGTFLSFGLIPLGRYLLTLLPGHKFRYYSQLQVRAIIAGEHQSIEKTMRILASRLPNVKVVAYISEKNFSEKVAGNLNNIKEIIQIYQAHEIIFCLGDYKAGEIIHTIFSLNNKALEFKIFTDGFSAVIGSNSVYADAGFVSVQNNSFTKFSYRFQKRLFDIIFALLLLLLYPILAIFMERGKFMRNICAVLAGKQTWVASEIDVFSANDFSRTPVVDVRPEVFLEDEVNGNHYFGYSKRYSFIKDLFNILKAVKKLGTKI